VIDAKLNGPIATIMVSFDPSRTNVRTIAEAAKASLDSDRWAVIRGAMAKIEYVKD